MDNLKIYIDSINETFIKNGRPELIISEDDIEEELKVLNKWISDDRKV